MQSPTETPSDTFWPGFGSHQARTDSYQSLEPLFRMMSTSGPPRAPFDDSALNNVVSVRGKPMSDTSHLREERMKFREDLQRHTDGAEALLDLHESAKNPEPEDITKMIHD
ncbi:v-myb avian myeloblastosis viral oncogene homolog-like 2a isoform X1 [Lates japonicus]|uniref:V-myb avian myeloblastosis viral oncogene homolog-like 2a isoform X1 n=1 Tax=Lates japonicus TaxID=270547 RepID=A0AAD3QXR4_LATJO|nr:v-myb avian myeloblastosis viral oncogene homolog-like 2a isoform X1 [Lates japonicus]